MRRILLALCAFLLLTPAARAVTVIGGGDDAPSRVAEAKAAASEVTVGHYGMTPIPGSLVADGDYDVKFESSSPFFKIIKATLHVAGGGMTADIVIGSESYDAVRMDAEIPGRASNGATTFTIPVPALNQPFACAAHSVKRDMWYDRQLLADASSLPEGALGFDLPDYEVLDKALRAYGEAYAPAAQAVEPAPVDLPDGEYSIEVNLSGGSGRASVSSPTLLTVKDGRAWARLLWSSAYYDYMLLGGARYENTSDGGNSVFDIPVAALDTPFAVIADTTAMGDPVEIEYQLTFYAESIGDRSQVPQEAAMQVLTISLIVIVVGGVLNHFVKRRRR